MKLLSTFIWKVRVFREIRESKGFQRNKGFRGKYGNVRVFGEYG